MTGGHFGSVTKPFTVMTKSGAVNGVRYRSATIEDVRSLVVQQKLGTLDFCRVALNGPDPWSWWTLEDFELLGLL